VFGGLVNGRATAQSLGQVRFGLVDRPGLHPHGPWRPVGGADRVEHCPPDPPGGEPGEGDRSTPVEATGGLDQTDHPRTDELFAVDVSGEPDGDLSDDLLDQIEVFLHQSAARIRLSGPVR
jgi:hypothetical protein